MTNRTCITIKLISISVHRTNYIGKGKFDFPWELSDAKQLLTASPWRTEGDHRDAPILHGWRLLSRKWNLGDGEAFFNVQKGFSIFCKLIHKFQCSRQWKCAMMWLNKDYKKVTFFHFFGEEFPSFGGGELSRLSGLYATLDELITITTTGWMKQWWLTETGILWCRVNEWYSQ